MSKLVIFLCTVLIASAVNASFVSDALLSAEAKVDGLIVATIDTSTQKFGDIESKALEYAAELEIAAKSASAKTFQDVKSTLEQAQAEISKHYRDDDGSETTDCMKLVSQLEDIGFDAITNMNECIDDKVATGSRYAQNIATLSKNVLANLTAIREEARLCGDNVADIKTAAAAIACTDMAALNAAWVETKVVPSLLIEMTKLATSLATIRPSLAYCSTTKEFVTFHDKSLTVVEKSEQCMHRVRLGAR